MIHMLSISKMPNVLVFLPPEMARDLEKLAPAKGRQRSDFIRLAIAKALMELQDIETMKAYERIPQDTPDAFSRGEYPGMPKPRRKKKAAAARRTKR